jgi:hypothetical protein
LTSDDEPQSSEIDSTPPVFSFVCADGAAAATSVSEPLSHDRQMIRGLARQARAMRAHRAQRVPRSCPDAVEREERNVAGKERA